MTTRRPHAVDRMPVIDPEVTTWCPRPAPRCESCGEEHPGIVVVTATFGKIGVGCWSACPRCRASGELPNVAVQTVFKIVGAHCAHLGIDLDQATEIMSRLADR